MRRLVWCFCLLALLAAFGCGSKRRAVVGVVPKGANHIFWQTVRAGALKAAQEFNFDIEWNAPTLEVDASRQIEILEAMINRRLAGIVATTQAVREELVNRCGVEKGKIAVIHNGVRVDATAFTVVVYVDRV